MGLKGRSYAPMRQCPPEFGIPPTALRAAKLLPVRVERAVLPIEPQPKNPLKRTCRLANTRLMLFSIAVVVLFIAPGTLAAPATLSSSVVSQIAGDMTGANEGYPHGVPLSYGWATGPMRGNATKPAPNWRAATAWGVAYEAAEGNPARNTRVNIRNMRLYLLQKSTNKWMLLQNTSAPDGGLYIEDFSHNAAKAADIRNEFDGSISVTAGGGYVFHFYPRERASINPKDIAGIITIFEARLILGDPKAPDDRSAARYLAASGGDYWPDVVGGLPAGATIAPLIDGGKLKYVQTYWRSFAMTTLTEGQLAHNPPPIDLTGIRD
jgi:hypothetical protein